MNIEKLKALQAQVRIGGKGTARRKKKVVHRTATTDDKKLQSSLKKLSVSNSTTSYTVWFDAPKMHEEMLSDSNKHEDFNSSFLLTLFLQDVLSNRFNVQLIGCIFLRSRKPFCAFSQMMLDLVVLFVISSTHFDLCVIKYPGAVSFGPVDICMYFLKWRIWAQ